MAMHPLRLRRTLTTLTTLHRTLSIPNPTVPAITATISNSTRSPLPLSSFGIFQSRWFRSSGSPLSSPRQYKLYKEGDEITEDTILFEGCDYNHWLIVVDFPKDNKPPPEEMIRTYERICAQGLGISVEEAKKRIYACSTTTYEGFQVLMSEEESEKFNDIPGVVFVLPDSYIDPVNKEYGGDKYENGVITPRPPPIQYSRNQGGRFRQNRNPDQPRYDRQGNPMQNQQGNPRHNQQGFVQGDGRNYRPPPNYPPQQNYGQQPPMNNRDYAPRGPDPSYQASYNQGVNYMPQERRDSFQKDWQNYPPEQRDSRGDQKNYAPTHGGNYGQNFGQGANPGHGQNFAQGANPGYGQNPGQGENPGHRQNFGQGANPGYGQNFGQGANPGGQNFGQGANPGLGQNFGQGTNPGYGQNFGQGANPGYGHSYGQGSNPASGQNYGPGATAGSAQRANPGYGQTDPRLGADLGFSQAEQRSVQGEPNGSVEQGGMQQGRY